MKQLVRLAGQPDAYGYAVGSKAKHFSRDAMIPEDFEGSRDISSSATVL